MRRLFPLVLLTLALTGCGSPTVRLSLSFDVDNPLQRTVLLEESKNVIVRRLSRFDGAVATNVQVEDSGSGAILLTFDVTNGKARNALIEELLAPYSLQLMTASTGTGDLFVEEQGWFNATGVTQDDIVWAEGAADQEGKGIVRLVFSQAGRARLASVFQANLGGTMGLFVRNRLMAKLPIDTAEPKEEIVISGIPVPDMARVFADDVNVGAHVTFSLP